MTLHSIYRTDSARAWDRLPERVAGIAGALSSRARDTERSRRVPDANMELLRSIGYFDIVKPREFGGTPGSFAQLVEANIAVSAACASTGWVAGLLSAHQWLLAMFPEQAQRDVWGDNPNALLCGSYAPLAMAAATEGGYRLNGRWSFASGCEVAQWALCAALLPAGGETRPVPAFLLVPAAQYTVDDTWDVVGLAGTGSKTLVLENVDVPAHRVLTFPQATSGKTPGAQLHPAEALFHMPLLTGIPSCLASTAVGAARGALDSYVASISTRVTRGAVAGGNNRMAEFPTIQLRVAEAAASIDAAQEILLRDVTEAERHAGANEAFSIDARLLSRRGQSFAVSLALRAVEALNASTGGLGLTMDNPVQRAWRDVNAVGRHISMNWDAVGTMTGQHLLGLEPKGQY